MSAATNADPRTVSRKLAELQPGDVIYAFHSARTGEWHNARTPLLVISALAPVNEDGPEGVEVFNRPQGGIQHVLYPDSIDEVEVVRQRGHASRDNAVRAARKVAGWTTKGGCYFLPEPGSQARYGYQAWVYAGIKGLDQAGPNFVKRGWIVEVNGRWFVTPLTAAYAAIQAARDAEASR